MSKHNRLLWPFKPRRVLRLMRQALRLRRYRRALRVLDRLGQPDLPTLVARAQNRLPFPPEELQRRFSKRLAETDGPMDLAFKYEELSQSLAWSHFMASCHGLQEDLKGAILRGKRDDFGKDCTEDLRRAYGILEAVVSIPESVMARQKFIEQNEIGLTGEDT